MRFDYETERLFLRILNDRYASQSLDFYEAGKDVFNPVEPEKPMGFYTMDYQRHLLKNEYDCFLDGTYMRYFFFEQEHPDRIIGTASFSRIEKGVYHCCTLGYKLLPEFQKQGYAFEAISRLLTAIFEENKMHRIEAFVLAENIPSIRLLERLGFECEGTARSVIYLRGHYIDHLRYALINPMD